MLKKLFANDTMWIMKREESLRTKDGGEYGVDWSVVKLKEYAEKFNIISDNQKANELAVQRAKNALVNRDGKDTEELYAISLSSGKDISSITDQNHPFGVERTEKFSADIKRALDKGEKILYIHNHPRSYPPSLTDLNELVGTDSVGIIACHDGSVYYYTAPRNMLSKRDYKVAFRKLAWYSEDDKENSLRALKELGKNFQFIISEL